MVETEETEFSSTDLPSFVLLISSTCFNGTLRWRGIRASIFLRRLAPVAYR